jgi:hypothetical protein
MININTNGEIWVHIAAGLGGASSSNRRTFNTNEKIRVGTWHRITVVFTSYNDMDVYIDCNKCTGTYSGSGAKSMQYSSHSGRLGEGAPNTVTPNPYYMRGAIDEVSLWKRALSENEITSICNSEVVFEEKPASILIEEIDTVIEEKEVPFIAETLIETVIYKADNSIIVQEVNFYENEIKVEIDKTDVVIEGEETLNKNILNSESFIDETIDILVFPNPSNGIFNVSLSNELLSDDLHFELYNSIGELIFNNKINNQLFQVDISFLPKGIYLIRVLDSKNELNITKQIVFN